MTRILVIGIDGGTFDIIEPMIRSGRVPGFAEMSKIGITAELRSTIPYVTAPGWTTMMTGVNPGRHGAFSMTTLNGYSPKPTDARYVKTKRVWDYLSDYGLKSLIVNLPITYPTRPLNGWMVTGTLTPSQESRFTYPPSLKDDILEKYPDYAPEIPEGLQGVERIYHGYAQSTIRRRELFKYLLDRYDWDLAICVFNETDKVQHKLMGISDNEIEKIYILIDEFLCYSLEKYKDCEILIVSDHGAGPIGFAFNINMWLMKNNYLKLKRMVQLKNWIRKRAGKTRGPQTGGVHKRSQKGFLRKIWENRFNYNDYSTVIDMRRSIAFGMESGVRINLLNREPMGRVKERYYSDVVESIKSDLDGFKDSKGKEVIEHVSSSKDLYHGPYSSDSADIIFTVANGGINRLIYPDSDIIEPPRTPGDHKRNGIFYYKSSRMNLGFQSPRLDIGEVTPMILYLLGVPIPSEMEFTVRKWMLTINPNKRLCTSDRTIEYNHEIVSIGNALQSLRHREEGAVTKP